MLIVEGTDLVGKTTFCHKLLDALNAHPELGNAYQYQHLTRLPPGFHRYWGYLPRMGRNLVQDRFHDSEMAYCYGRDENCMLTEETYQLVQAQLDLLGAYKVVITATENLLEERFKRKHKDEMYTISVIQRANEWFIDNGSRFDCEISCNGSNLWPEIGEIVERYVARQFNLSLTVLSKPTYYDTL